MATGNTFAATALSSYGGFWIAIAVTFTPGGFEIMTELEKADNGSLGMFYDSFGLFLLVRIICVIREAPWLILSRAGSFSPPFYCSAPSSRLLYSSPSSSQSILPSSCLALVISIESTTSQTRRSSRLEVCLPSSLPSWLGTVPSPVWRITATASSSLLFSTSRGLRKAALPVGRTPRPRLFKLFRFLLRL